MHKYNRELWPKGKKKKHAAARTAAESSANSINPRGIRVKILKGHRRAFEVAVATITVFATTMHKKSIASTLLQCKTSLSRLNATVCTRRKTDCRLLVIFFLY